MFNALPKSARKGVNSKDPLAMAKAIYQHWDKIDVDTLVFELLWNFVSDAALGKVYAGVPKANVMALGLVQRDAAKAGAGISGKIKGGIRDVLNAHGMTIGTS